MIQRWNVFIFAVMSFQILNIRKHGIDGYFSAESKKHELQSVFFKFNSGTIALKETLPRRLIYKTDKTEKTALLEIPYHISHLTHMALDHIISKVVHI